MEVKKGYLVTMEDGYTEFIDWTEVHPLEADNADSKGVIRKYLAKRNERKSEIVSKPFNFMTVLKWFVYLILMFGEVMFFLDIFTYERVGDGVFIFILVNMGIAFVCWLFYNLMKLAEID